MASKKSKKFSLDDAGINSSDLRTVWTNGTHHCSCKIEIVTASTGTMQVVFFLTDKDNGAVHQTRVSYLRGTDSSWISAATGVMTARFRSFIDIGTDKRIDNVGTLEKLVAFLADKDLEVITTTKRITDVHGNANVEISTWLSPDEYKVASAAADKAAKEVLKQVPSQRNRINM
tara:strand:- start:746 stop:1267 length:522 start_codon:yes stop_codon:yes gene_type:complete